MKKLILGLAFCLCEITIEAGSLGGSGNSYFAYQGVHNVFYDQQSAVGYVRMDNGFTVAAAIGVGGTHGSCVYLDTCLSVSGYIDLRDTNTMILLSDLHLDSGLSFSSSGKIYGKNTALILHGNLNLPNNIVLHFGGNMAINGNGNTLSLGENSQIFVDTDATLTLRNLIISNSKNGVGNPAIKLASSGSQLALDNSILDMTGDFYFGRGSIFIHNDVIFTGTNTLVYTSCQPSFITSGASLMFDAGTTFSIAPSTFTDFQYSAVPTLTSNNFIRMSDSSSSIIFNGCNVCTTFTGCRFTNGSMFLCNAVSLRTNVANDISSINTAPVVAVGSTVSGNINSVAWSPDGRYLAVSGDGLTKQLRIFYFDGSGSLTFVASDTSASTPISAAWSPDGKYIAMSDFDNKVLLLYSFLNGTLTKIATANINAVATYSVRWSPDGKYISVASVNSSVQILKFNGITAIAGSVLALSATDFNWSPDGKFLAACTYTTPGTVGVYRFSYPAAPTIVGSLVSCGNSCYQIEWSPDGRFIAVVNFGSSSVQVFSFDGSGRPFNRKTATTYANPCAVKWLPDGRYFVVASSGMSKAQLFYFDGMNNPTVVGQIGLPYASRSLGSSADGKFISFGVAGNNTGVYVCKISYIRSSGVQGCSNCLAFGNSSAGSSYDLNVRLLSDSFVEVDGLVNYDNVS